MLLQGPAWVTGGVLGTEASFFIYPSTALMFLYIWWRRFNIKTAPDNTIATETAVRQVKNS